MGNRSVRALSASAVFVAALSLTLATEPSRQLSFDDRVTAQLALERVYHSHRTGTSRSLEATVTRDLLETKVRKYLASSLALEHYWKRPVTAEMLEGEVERMVQQSKMPRRLQEVFDALGNDPVLIQECLSRQTLANRLVDLYFGDDERIPEQTSSDAWLDTFSTLHGDGAFASVARSALASARSRLSATLTSDPTGCSTGVWRHPLASQSTPARREHASVVWTGSEMIVWGYLLEEQRHLGERYDPLTETWVTISNEGAPDGQRYHTAVWTGSEMIIWGGEGGSNDARYDPISDTWAPVSAEGAPDERRYHTAVWTGSEMIVWGGYGATSSGGRYDPASDTWRPLSADDAPSNRRDHTAIWTGSEMIIWGGYGPLNTGGRYDPVRDSWLPMSRLGAPAPRYYHTATWTGDKMIVWGGDDVQNPAPHEVQTGGIYDPETNSWQPTSLINAPSPREHHSAVWTGTELVVWGGFVDYPFSDNLLTGGRYDPATDTWLPVSLTNVPDARYSHDAVWTGSEMIVWGGFIERGTQTLSSGGRYDPATNSWTPTPLSSNGAPVSKSWYRRLAVWTGAEMIVWVGNPSSARYDPVTAGWTSIAGIGQPADRIQPHGVWTGDEMIVWGGYRRNGSNVNNGARYDPLTDAWTPMSAVGGVQDVVDGTTIWTGAEMIVWGCWYPPNNVGFGGRYNPTTDSWASVSSIDAPDGTRYHSAVWTGAEMIVWGGLHIVGSGVFNFSPGGRYDPVTDTWGPVSTTGAPVGRERHSAVWTGEEMIVWGGRRPTDQDSDPEHYASGGRYDPFTDSWTMISTVDVPDAREGHTAVWTGDEMIVWGGADWWWLGSNIGYGVDLASGGHYDPQSDTWWPTSTINPPRGRSEHSSFWTGEEMLVWGGEGGIVGGDTLEDGALYGASEDLDEDGYCSPADCDESDPSIHNDAPEINDGIDNQCPGDLGFGAVDEISGSQSFGAAGWLSWVPQEGATLYQVAHSSAPDFSTDCAIVTTSSTTYDSSTSPDPSDCRYYLVRALAPNEGSWGLNSSGSERVVDCD